MTHLLAQNALPAGGAGDPVVGTKRRVLYAEDSTSSRIVTTAMLKKLGFLVDAVEDGELALNLAKSHDYDLILLDIEMPVMDGVTAARSIRSGATRQAQTPILALSAFLADSTEQSVWRDAFDSALPKPANSNELLVAMNRAIAMRAPKPVVLQSPIIAHPADASSMLQGLRQSMGGPLFLRLMATAAEEMRLRILVLASCVESGDQDGFEQAAHSLAGTAANFSNEALAQRCHALRQQSIGSGSPDLFMELLGSVENWYNQL
jgi:CheY-like chemotaxis protein/HPt (histidine-containing phosphotransfer) domain-containing protein